MKRYCRYVYKFVLALPLLPTLPLLSIVARSLPKRATIGLGPLPLINNVYHKRALALVGYKAETFCLRPYFITRDFDRVFDRFCRRSAVLDVLDRLICHVHMVTRFRCLYLYFDGGVWGEWPMLWRIEPLLFRLAGAKTVLMPYGSDIQDMRRSSNWRFRQAVESDYPEQKFSQEMVSRRVDMWTRRADHVISGCDWIEYLPSWDTLMLAHFSIDTDAIRPSAGNGPQSRPLVVLHAPNHKAIKGTAALVDACRRLNDEGVAVDLRIIQGISNDRLLEEMRSADVIADQFVIGWYAMFALEGCALGKPVMTYIRDDFRRFYRQAGLLEEGELPFVSADESHLYDELKKLALMTSDERSEIGRKARAFAERHHSIRAVGSVFARINDSLGIALEAS